MRRIAMLGLMTLAAVTSLPVVAQAQEEQPLTFRVAPRSFLNPGNVVEPGSLGGSTVTMAYRETFMNRPSAWWSARDLYGEGRLPDPAFGPGPFVGAANPFADIDTTGSIR